MLRQIWIVSLLNFRSLPSRLWQSLVIVLGMACVIGVLLSMLSVTNGIHRAYLNTGDPRNVIVLTAGTEWEGGSAITRDQARVIMSMRGIARQANGAPLANPGLMVSVPGFLRANHGKTQIDLRGLDAGSAMLRPDFHIVSGRMFRPGTHELIAGIHTKDQFESAALGDRIILPDGAWPIVGTFIAGDMRDGELFGDTETLMLSVKHKAYTSVLLRLERPDGFAAFSKALKTNPALNVDVMRLPDWNEKRSAGFSQVFNVIVYGIGLLLAVGALFGCFNTMYAAVAARSGEIATLRALGYGGLPVAISVLLEAALLSVTGALIGAAYAWWRYDGVLDGLGSDVFTMTVSPAMIGMALLWAIGVALLGGILPSVQAARAPVSRALQAT